jgi:hypothetical protein
MIPPSITPINSPVLVWREGNTRCSGTWTGPYLLLSLDGETCRIALPSGPTEFWSTSVKPLNIPEEETKDNQSEEQDSKPEHNETESPRRNPRRMNRAWHNLANITISLDNLDNDEIADSDTESPIPEPLNNVTKNGHAPNPPFIDSRKKEIDGLFDKGAYKN